MNTLKINKEMIRRKNPIIQERRVNQATNQDENTVKTKKPKILKMMLSEKHKIIEMKAQRRKSDPGKDQTVCQTHREAGEAAHGQDDRCASGVAEAGSKCPCRPQKPRRFIKLQFVDKA